MNVDIMTFCLHRMMLLYMAAGSSAIQCFKLAVQLVYKAS